MKILSLVTLSIFLLLGFNACSSSQNAVTETIKKAPSIYPVWYQNAEFSSDTLGFSGYATAIASDSLMAIERANQQAKVHLEKQIGKITEEIRLDIEKSGSTTVNNTDFIIILREAHSEVINASSPLTSIAKKMDGHFRGFSSVRITKSDVKSLLESGFSGHPKYWAEFSGSTAFQDYF